MTENPELAAFASTMKADLMAFLKSDILPAIDTAAKAAVASASPAAAVVADPVIDIIDSYIAQLLGNAAPAVTADTSPASRLEAVEKHVAALTVATGHGTTAAMPNIKAAAAVLPDPEEASATQKTA